MVLPEVTLCAPQTFNVTKLNDDGLSLDITNFMASTFNAAPNSTFTSINDYTIQDLEERRDQVFQHASSWKEFLDKYSIKCEEFFVTCKMDWHQFNCCEAFQVLYTPAMGVCFQDKEMAEKMQQSHAGVNGSLEVLLRTPNTVGYWNGGPMWTGITIGLPYLYDPYISMPGQFLMARIAASYYIRDSLDMNCKKPARRMSRESGCAHTAWNDAVEEVCNCTLYLRRSDAEGKNVTVCDPFSKIICMRRSYDTIMALYEKNMQDWCRRHLCTEWDFGVALSYAQINRDDHVLRHVLKHHLSKFSPEKENMISSVGGLMGLWLGCSMLSVIELFVFGLSLLSSKMYNWFSIESAYRIDP